MCLSLFLFPTKCCRRFVRDVVVDGVHVTGCLDAFRDACEQRYVQVGEAGGHDVFGDNRAEDDRGVPGFGGPGEVYGQVLEDAGIPAGVFKFLEDD